MAKNNFDLCDQCGVATHETCEICEENVCPYCVEDHDEEVHNDEDMV